MATGVEVGDPLPTWAYHAAVPPPDRPTLEVSRVHSARQDDIPRLAEVLTRAFAEDPFFSWVAGDAPGREERMRKAWAGTLRHASAGLTATYTTEDLAGAAIWVPPDRPASTLLDSLRLTPSMGRLTGWGRLRKVAAALALIEEQRHHHVPGPHAYLSALGVEPDRQGQGIGTALMRPMLERCDRDGVPAYLETALARNLPLYERLGFTVVAEMRLEEADVSGWLMLRPAAG